MSKKRILYIDLLKFIAIFFVTWGHVMGQFGTHSLIANYETEWGLSFHMPLFAILSGWFFCVPSECTVLQLFIKKVKSLLIPNVVWAFIFYVVMHGMYILLQQIMGTNDLYQGSLLADWWNAIYREGWWFLRALFFVYIYAILSVYFTRKLLRNNIKHEMLFAGIASNALLYIASFTGIIPNHYQPVIGAIYLYPFVWTGVALRYLSEVDKPYLFAITVICFILWGCGLFFWDVSYTFYGMNTSIFAKTGSIVGLNIIWITGFSYIIGVVSSYAIICCVRLLFEQKVQGDSMILDRISEAGKYTLFMYVAPSFFFHLVRQRVMFENEMASFLFCTLTTIAIIIVCYWCAKFIDRWKWSRRLMLGIWK